MKGLLLFIARFYVSVVLVMALLKPCFMLLNPVTYGDVGIVNGLSVMWGGLAMDCSMGAYFTMVVCLLMIAAQWIKSQRVTTAIVRGYFIFVATVISVVFILDSMLYGYWGFKLDTTPLFYFKSSPSLALASVSALEIFLGIAGVVAGAAALYKLLKVASGKLPFSDSSSSTRGRLVRSGAMLLSCGLLFIPMRGGFTVSTMNLSSAYFSSDNRLNHAAVNPLFSLMYSASHSGDYSTAFPFYDDEETETRFNSLNRQLIPDSVEVKPLVNVASPDIYLIILESFSNHLFPSLGGEPIATGLDSIARDGLLFDRFYASGFRTDRGIPAILSGYPSMPTAGVMKDIAKAESLPSIASALAGKGYESEYYYGGDANFTNMRAYLVSSGFTTIVSDKDFPIAQRLSKWGVPDGPLFERVIENITPYDSLSPRFRVIQTSSSHEPFDVDRRPRSADDPREVTAFAYADSCVTAFVNHLKSTPDWSNSLIVLVPDHYGCYPKGLEKPADRHIVPFIITGGALATRGTNHTVGSQTDIAATLLAGLGLSHDEFRFSNNLLDNRRPHYAFFSSPNEFSFVNDGGCVSIDVNTDTPLVAEGDTTAMAGKARAYLQTIYRDLSRR